MHLVGPLFDSNSIRCVVGRSGKVSLASVVRVRSLFPRVQCLGQCPVSFRFREAMLLLFESFSVLIFGFSSSSLIVTDPTCRTIKDTDMA